MNESDTEANTKAIDSLLNYETVKYSATRSARPGATTSVPPTKGQRKSRTRWLCSTAGRLVFTRGAAPVMVMAGLDVAAGTKTSAISCWSTRS